MAFFERTRDAATEDLHEQIDLLSRQVATLQKALRKRGQAAYDDGRESAADFYGEAWDRMQDALPLLRRRAHQAEQVARDNPHMTAAVVGLALAGLAIAFLSKK